MVGGDPLRTLDDGCPRLLTGLRSGADVRDIDDETDMDGLAYWQEHPHPSDEELQALCEVWLTYHRGRRSDPDNADPHQWAAEAVMLGEMRRDDGSVAWRLIKSLCSLIAPDDALVETIGVGPVEGLISRYGEDAMDRIEPEAERNPVLLHALTYIWATSSPARPRLERYLGRHGLSAA